MYKGDPTKQTLFPLSSKLSGSPPRLLQASAHQGTGWDVFSACCGLCRCCPVLQRHILAEWVFGRWSCQSLSGQYLNRTCGESKSAPMSHKFKATYAHLDLQGDNEQCNGRRLAETTGSVAHITYMLLFAQVAHLHYYHVANFPYYQWFNQSNGFAHVPQFGSKPNTLTCEKMEIELMLIWP